MITSLLRVVSRLVLNALFTSSDKWWKHSSVLVNLAAFLAVIINGVSGDLKLTITSASTLILLAAVIRSRSMFYATALGVIPAVWYFITTLPFTRDPISSLHIAVRVALSSIALIYFILTVNPMEISYLAGRLGGRVASILPPLMWKSVPHILKDFEEALRVCELKGVKVWRAVATSVLATIEYGDLYDEGLFAKLDAYTPKYKYRPDALALFASITALNVIAWLLLKLILS